MNRAAVACAVLSAGLVGVGLVAPASPWSWPSLVYAPVAAFAAVALLVALRQPGARLPPWRFALPRTLLVAGALVVGFVAAGRLSLVAAYEGDPLHLELAGVAMACAGGIVLLTVVTSERGS